MHDPLPISLGGEKISTAYILADPSRLFVQYG